MVLAAAALVKNPAKVMDYCACAALHSHALSRASALLLKSVSLRSVKRKVRSIDHLAGWLEKRCEGDESGASAAYTSFQELQGPPVSNTVALRESLTCATSERTPPQPAQCRASLLAAWLAPLILDTGRRKRGAETSYPPVEVLYEDGCEQEVEVAEHDAALAAALRQAARVDLLDQQNLAGPQYIGVRELQNGAFRVTAFINGRQRFVHDCSTAESAAALHDAAVLQLSAPCDWQGRDAAAIRHFERLRRFANESGLEHEGLLTLPQPHEDRPPDAPAPGIDINFEADSMQVQAMWHHDAIKRLARELSGDGEVTAAVPEDHCWDVHLHCRALDQMCAQAEERSGHLYDSLGYGADLGPRQSAHGTPSKDHAHPTAATDFVSQRAESGAFRKPQALPAASCIPRPPEDPEHDGGGLASLLATALVLPIASRACCCTKTYLPVLMKHHTLLNECSLAAAMATIAACHGGLPEADDGVDASDVPATEEPEREEVLTAALFILGLGTSCLSLTEHARLLKVPLDRAQATAWNAFMLQKVKSAREEADWSELVQPLSIHGPRDCWWPLPDTPTSPATQLAHGIAGVVHALRQTSSNPAAQSVKIAHLADADSAQALLHSFVAWIRKECMPSRYADDTSFRAQPRKQPSTISVALVPQLQHVLKHTWSRGIPELARRLGIPQPEHLQLWLDGSEALPVLLEADICFAVQQFLGALHALQAKGFQLPLLPFYAESLPVALRAFPNMSKASVLRFATSISPRVSCHCSTAQAQAHRLAEAGFKTTFTAEALRGSRTSRGRAPGGGHDRKAAKHAGSKVRGASRDETRKRLAHERMARRQTARVAAAKTRREKQLAREQARAAAKEAKLVAARQRALTTQPVTTMVGGCKMTARAVGHEVQGDASEGACDADRCGVCGSNCASTDNALLRCSGCSCVVHQHCVCAPWCKAATSDFFFCPHCMHTLKGAFAPEAWAAHVDSAATSLECAVRMESGVVTCKQFEALRSGLSAPEGAQLGTVPLIKAWLRLEFERRQCCLCGLAGLGLPLQPVHVEGRGGCLAVSFAHCICALSHWGTVWPKGCRAQRLLDVSGVVQGQREAAAMVALGCTVCGRKERLPPEVHSAVEKFPSVHYSCALRSGLLILQRPLLRGWISELQATQDSPAALADALEWYRGPASASQTQASQLHFRLPIRANFGVISTSQRGVPLIPANTASVRMGSFTTYSDRQRVFVDSMLAGTCAGLCVPPWLYASPRSDCANIALNMLVHLDGHPAPVCWPHLSRTESVVLHLAALGDAGCVAAWKRRASLTGTMQGTGGELSLGDGMDVLVVTAAAYAVQAVVPAHVLALHQAIVFNHHLSESEAAPSFMSHARFRTCLATFGPPLLRALSRHSSSAKPGSERSAVACFQSWIAELAELQSDFWESFWSFGMHSWTILGAARQQTATRMRSNLLRQVRWPDAATAFLSEQPERNQAFAESLEAHVKIGAGIAGCTFEGVPGFTGAADAQGAGGQLVESLARKVRLWAVWAKAAGSAQFTLLPIPKSKKKALRLDFPTPPDPEVWQVFLSAAPAASAPSDTPSAPTVASGSGASRRLQVGGGKRGMEGKSSSHEFSPPTRPKRQRTLQQDQALPAPAASDPPRQAPVVDRPRRGSRRRGNVDISELSCLL